MSTISCKACGHLRFEHNSSGFIPDMKKFPTEDYRCLAKKCDCKRYVV